MFKLPLHRLPRKYKKVFKAIIASQNPHYKLSDYLRHQREILGVKRTEISLGTITVHFTETNETLVSLQKAIMRWDGERCIIEIHHA